MKTLAITTLFLPTALAALQAPTNCDPLPLPNPTTTTIYSRNVDQLITLISETRGGRELHKSFPSNVQSAFKKFQRAELKHSSMTPYVPLHIARIMYDYIVQHQLYCFPTPRALWGYLIQLGAVDFHGQDAVAGQSPKPDSMIGAKFKLSPGALAQISTPKEGFTRKLPTLLTAGKLKPNFGGSDPATGWTGVSIPISGMGMQNQNDAEEPPMSELQDDEYNYDDLSYDDGGDEISVSADSDEVEELPAQTGSSTITNPWAPGGDLDDKRRRRLKLRKRAEPTTANTKLPTADIPSLSIQDINTNTNSDTNSDTNMDTKSLAKLLNIVNIPSTKQTEDVFQFFDLHILRQLETVIQDFMLPIEEILREGILDDDDEYTMREVSYPWKKYARIANSVIRGVDDIVFDLKTVMRTELMSAEDMKAEFERGFNNLGGFPAGPVENLFLSAPEEAEQEMEEEGKVGPLVKGSD
ncbi:hypothetical protein TWF694_011041 [Orbilia ellipsospora]|uniref:Uncharacterized protein n=1 Tax=Orbilia ellipsospora TaxID=2528407 RepID=A0AAV9X8S4_9PEZI